MKSKHAIAAIIGAILVVVLGALGFSAAASGGGGGNDHKTSLCHRTASDTNPYVFITVDNSALPAHLNNLPGHPAKHWKTDGTWRGVPHQAGDLKNDYIATDASECQNFTETTPPTTEPTCQPDSKGGEPSCPPTTEPTTPPTSPPTTEPTSPPTHKPRVPSPPPSSPPVVIEAGL